MSKATIKPNFYKDFTFEVEETLKDDEKKLDENQAALAYITHYKGWSLLKEYKERLLSTLDQMLSTSISQGASISEIGERAMIKEMAKFVLESLISKAEDARRIEEK